MNGPGRRTLVQLCIEDCAQPADLRACQCVIVRGEYIHFLRPPLRSSLPPSAQTLSTAREYFPSARCHLVMSYEVSLTRGFYVEEVLFGAGLYHILEVRGRGLESIYWDIGEGCNDFSEIPMGSLSWSTAAGSGHNSYLPSYLTYILASQSAWLQIPLPLHSFFLSEGRTGDFYSPHHFARLTHKLTWQELGGFQ